MGLSAFNRARRFRAEKAEAKPVATGSPEKVIVDVEPPKPRGRPRKDA